MIDLSEKVVRGHETFRSVLLAFSYPGRRFMLPAASGNREAAELLVASLWNRGTAIHHAGRRGATSGVTPEQAAVMIVEGRSSSGALTRLPRGTDEAPERGATAVYLIADDAAAGVRVALTGPGVNGRLATRLPLDPGEMLARAEVCTMTPRGVDVLLVHHGAVVGLPRTTQLAIEE